MSFLTRVIVTVIVFMGYSMWFPENLQMSGIGVAVLAALVLSFLNAVLRPIVMILSLPLLILTLGLGGFIINAAMLLLTSAIVGTSFHLSGFGSALLLALILTVVNMIVTDFMIRRKKDKEAQRN
jgi:putative membrane protein